MGVYLPMRCPYYPYNQEFPCPNGWCEDYDLEYAAFLAYAQVNEYMVHYAGCSQCRAAWEMANIDPVRRHYMSDDARYKCRPCISGVIWSLLLTDPIAERRISPLDPTTIIQL